MPFVVSIFLAYMIPAYVMGGLSDKEQPDGSLTEINTFFVFIGKSQSQFQLESESRSEDE